MRQRYCGYALPHEEHTYVTRSNTNRTSTLTQTHFYNAGDPIEYECPGYDEESGSIIPDITKDEGDKARPAASKKSNARDRELFEFYMNSWDRRFSRNGYSGRSEEVS